MEPLVEQVLGAIRGCFVAARQELAGLFAEAVAAFLPDAGDRGNQRLAGTRMNNRFPEARQHLFVEHVDAAAHVDLVDAEAEPETGNVPRLLLALPEEDIEVVLVGPLVLAEPDVAVDAADGAVDLGLELRVGRELPE